MSDISNVLRKVIELDISLGLDGTQEALDEITRLTSEAAWARGAAEQAERQIEEAHKAIPAHCWRDPPKGRAWTIGEAITRLTAEVERLRSLTVVQETLIRKAEAESEKLRSALLVAHKYVLVQSCELSLMPEDAARDLAIIDEALEEGCND